ncbi:MAG: GNAT family N-acetyltransferase [Anaerolineae bacterium]|nr:GNAT family N-acetyltransferase [Anaerolineae bacterium]
MTDDIARRLDLAEAWSDVTHATAQARLYPETGAASLPVAGGHAVYCGQPSPLNRACGLGMSGPVTTADLDALEDFYVDRGVDMRVRICPHADASLVRLLGERGYVLAEFMNVYARPVGDPLGADSIPTDVEVRVANEAEARQWFERAGYAGDWAQPDGIAFMVIRTVLKQGARLYLAWKDGQPVGGGAVEIHAGVAALMAAATLPDYRRMGIHGALMRARLAAAADEGCDVAMAHTRPGAMSQGNVLRTGFHLLYTTVDVAKGRA